MIDPDGHTFYMNSVKCILKYWIAVIFAATAFYSMAHAENLINKVFLPGHYGGATRVTLTLENDGTVNRGRILNNRGGALQWIVEKDKKIVIRRSTKTERSYSYFQRDPADYKIYLQQYIDGGYQVISNVVGYSISNGGKLSGLVELRPFRPVKTAIVRLPMHTNYHEISYQVIGGRAIYQGDIDLGPSQKIQQTSLRNQKRFSSGLSSKSLLRLASRTKFAKLKNQLKIKNIDQLLSEQRGQNRSAFTRNPADLWPNGRVPFAIAPNQFSTATTVRIFDAIRHINELTSVNIIWKEEIGINGDFPEQEGDDEHFINIVKIDEPGVGGRSQVGRERDGDPEGQKLWLSGSVSFGSIVHEFLHALGFYHTQSRWDRDTFVCIRLENVDTSPTDFRHNFNVHDDSFDVAYGAYDTESIMHYSSCAFTNCGSCWANLNSCATILPLTNGACETRNIGGQRNGLSQTDIDAINWLYTDIGASDGGQGTLTNITVSISRLTTTAGPEENGVGCNDDMDFYANIKLATASFDPATNLFAISTSSETEASFAKIEGNDITPTGWRINLPLRPNDRYIVATLSVFDDDKSGAAGIGACGGGDDPVSVQNVDPFTSSARLLIDTQTQTLAERIRTINAMESIGFRVTNKFNRDNLSPLNTLFGDTTTLTGRVSTPHAANMDVVVDVQ